jgi:hypothetical protein
MRDMSFSFDPRIDDHPSPGSGRLARDIPRRHLLERAADHLWVPGLTLE